MWLTGGCARTAAKWKLICSIDVAELSPRSRHGASPPTWQSRRSCGGGTVVLDGNLSFSPRSAFRAQVNTCRRFQAPPPETAVPIYVLTRPSEDPTLQGLWLFAPVRAKTATERTRWPEAPSCRSSRHSSFEGRQSWILITHGTSDHAWLPPVLLAHRTIIAGIGRAPD